MRGGHPFEGGEGNRAKEGASQALQIVRGRCCHRAPSSRPFTFLSRTLIVLSLLGFHINDTSTTSLPTSTPLCFRTFLPRLPQSNSTNAFNASIPMAFLSAPSLAAPRVIGSGAQSEVPDKFSDKEFWDVRYQENATDFDW